MGLLASDKGNGSDFEPTPEGMHHAVVCGIFDIGTQYSDFYKKSARKVILQWEIPGERIEVERDGAMVDLPRVASKQYTLSLHKKAILRQHLETWRGKAFTIQELEGFDLEKLVNPPANCTLQIIHDKVDDKTYANVNTVMPAMKGEERVTPEGTARFFSFDSSTSIPDGTPDWIREKIEAADEYPAWSHTRGGGSDVGEFVDNLEEDDEDSIPF